MTLQRTISGVTVDYSSFISAHGKQPKGYGCWVFDLGCDKAVFLRGTFAECTKQAVAVAKSQGVERVSVGS